MKQNGTHHPGQNPPPSDPQAHGVPPRAANGRKKGILTGTEELKPILALGVGTEPEPFDEDDVSVVLDWARDARIGSTFLGLLLAGLIVPSGVKADGDIGFRDVDGSLPPAKAKRYRAKLEQAQRGWRWTAPRTFRIAGEGRAGSLLARPEKASLRLAVDAGRKCAGQHAGLDASHMLAWAAECRSGQILLARILAGDVLPLVDPVSGKVTFREVAELPVRDQEEYRGKLRRLDEQAA